MKKMLLIFSAISLNCIASQVRHTIQPNSPQTSSHNNKSTPVTRLNNDESTDVDRKIAEIRAAIKSQQQKNIPNSSSQKKQSPILETAFGNPKEAQKDMELLIEGLMTKSKL